MEHTRENGSSLPFKRHAESAAEGDGARDKAARKDTGDVTDALNRLLATGHSPEELLAELMAKASQSMWNTSGITRHSPDVIVRRIGPSSKIGPSGIFDECDW
jgi:hypothetical protein